MIAFSGIKFFNDDVLNRKFNGTCLASSDTSNAEKSFDENLEEGWQSSGENDDSITSYIERVLNNAVSGDTLVVANHNLKNLNIYINDTLFSDYTIKTENNFSVLKFNSLQTNISKIKISASQTIVANSEKQVGNILLLKEIGQFIQPQTVASKLNIEQSELSLQSGKKFVFESGRYWEIDISIFSLEQNDIDLVNNLINLQKNLYIWLCGGNTEQITYKFEPYKFKNFIKVSLAKGVNPYEIPSDTGIVYQQYSAIVANRWTIYNSASGITISDGKISFTGTSVGGGIVGSFSVTQNQIDLIKVEIEIESYVSGTLLVKFYDTLDTAPVRFLRDFNRQNRWFAVIVRPSLVSDGRFVIYSNDGFTGNITHGGAKEAKLYEDNWVDISQYLIDKSFSTSQVLDAKSWEFGEVQQDNMKLSFINVNGELSDESNVNSFFANRFIKHQSKVKVGIVLNDEETTIFEGLVDERACSSDTQGPALIKEKLVVFSYMKLFSNLTISALGNATTTLMTTIQSAINYIIDYGYFKYFVPQAIINVANDAYIDISQYSGDTKLSEVLQDLAKGQSAFWIDYNNTFHFSPVFSSSNNIYDFGLSPERKIKIFDYSAGADGVIENFYWENVNNINYIAKKQKYSTSETINIKSITSPVTRQNIINICGENFSRKRITCKLEIPLCPFIEILDEIKVSNVKDINTENVGGAKFIDKIFIVNGIKHSNNITTLHLIEKKWNFKVFNNLSTGKDDLPLEVIFDDYPQHQGEYIITLSAEQGCSDGLYINQATGATIKVKVILTSTDKIKIVKIKGGNLGDSHGGCGLALYVNGILLAVAGGGSCNENNNIGLGGGGYYAGKGHNVDGYDYLGTRTYINTSSDGTAVGGKQ